jgi:hypothetical protein
MSKEISYKCDYCLKKIEEWELPCEDNKNKHFCSKCYRYLNEIHACDRCLSECKKIEMSKVTINPVVSSPITAAPTIEEKCNVCPICLKELKRFFWKGFYFKEFKEYFR